MATAPTYITHKELKRIFPQMDEFDQKVQVFGWESLGNNVYEAQNTGLITQLFSDGRELGAITSFPSAGSGTETTQTALVASPEGQVGGDYSQVVIGDSDHAFQVGDILMITSSGNLERMLLTAITEATYDVLTVRRGFAGTTPVAHSSSSSISKNLRLDEIYSWYYSPEEDMVLLYSATDPNDLLIEAGEDFSTMVTQYTADASRYFDSRVDPSLPKNQLKDKAGNYDYMVVRTVGLIAASFMIKTKDHASELAVSFMEEANNNIALLNEGKAALSWQNTADAPQGIIRDVSYTDGSVRPVDTRGEYSGTFDLIRVLIVNGGAMDGTATYSVWVKDGDKLGNQQGTQVVTAEKINGDFQALAGGLQIRFGGNTKTSVATATNEWEIEVTGRGEYVDSSDMKSIKLTRTGTPARRYYK